MTVLYSDRTLPLSVNSGSALATGLNLAFDFTDFDPAHSSGTAWKTPAASATLNKQGTMAAITRYGIPGRQLSVNNDWYRSSTPDAGTQGLQVGTGDFTHSVLFGTPTTMPASTGTKCRLMALYGGAVALAIEAGYSSGNGCYVTVTAGASTIISAVSADYFAPNKLYVATIRRVSGTLSLHVTDVAAGTTRIQGSVAWTTSLGSSNCTDLLLGWVTATGGDFSLHGYANWNIGLSDATISGTLGTDFFSMNANGAAASTISVSSPTAGQSIGGTTTISGTSTGTVPSGVEVQFNGGSWIALTGFAYNSGNWSGTVSGLPAGTGNLIARKANETATVSAAVTGVNVVADNITIGNVPAYRLFQRNVASNTADIALSGTYAGSVTGIEWRFGSGAWTALTGATIAGGNWSGTASGVPTGSGALQVRFANNTIVVGSVTGVSVGDIWICGGQSNMQGRGSTANSYTPSGGLMAHKWNSGTWAELTDPYDTASLALGSFIPMLATKMLAAGVPVAFVGCAEGGTAISQWQKGGTYYNRMLSRYTSAGGAARGLLWLQGETDVQNGVDTATYQAALNQMVNDWFADTGLKTVVFRVHEGGPGTVAQHDAIREALTLVGTNNSHAVLGPDTVGIETTDVHFLTTTKLQQVADRAWPCIATEFYNMRKVSVPLVSAAGSARANLRNIKYAFFDQGLPANFAAPTATGGGVGLGAVTDSAGNIKIPLPNTTLTAGQTGFLILSDTDGVTSGKAFAAPVVVS